MSAKLWLYSVMALILVGCLSEQERLERARQEKVRQEEQEKEAAQKREKLRAVHLEEYWRDVAANNVAMLEEYVLGRSPDERKGRKRKGGHYAHYDKRNAEEIQQLLHEWVKGARKDVWSNAKLQAGAAELEAFGLKYMPNAYSHYEKVRDAALECQQVFEENFSKFEDPKGDKDKWKTFKSALTAFSNARTQSLRRKDELSHYYLLYKVGAITQNELLELDQKPIVLWLLEKEPTRQDIEYYRFDLLPYVPLDEKTKAFVAKFMAETSPVVERLEARCKVTGQLFADVCAAMGMLGYVRYDLSKIACWEESKCIVQELTKANEKIKDWHLKYKMMTLNSVELNQKDAELSKHLKGLEVAIKDYVKIRTRGSLFPPRRLLDAYYDGKYVRAWQLRALGFYGEDYIRGRRVDDDDLSAYKSIHVGYDQYDQMDIGGAIDRSVFASLLNKEVISMFGGETRGDYLCVSVPTDRVKVKLSGTKYCYCGVDAEISAFKFNEGWYLDRCSNVSGLVCPLFKRRDVVPILTSRVLDVDNKVYGFKCDYKEKAGGPVLCKVEVCQ